MNSLLQDRTSDARRPTAFVPFAAVAILGFACVAAAAAWTAMRSDAAIESARRAGLAAAVEELVASHLSIVEAAAREESLAVAAPPAAAAALRHLRQSGTGAIAGNLILLRNGMEVMARDGEIGGSRHSLPLATALTAPPAVASGARAAAVSREGAAFIVADAPLGQDGRSVVAVTELGPAQLSMLAWKSGASFLRASDSRPAGDGELALSLDRDSADGDAGPWLVWSPTRLVDKTLVETLPLIVVLTALFGAWVMFHLRRVNAELLAGAARAAHLAAHDPLTDLPNRAQFAELAQAAFARAGAVGEPCAVFCIDLRRFKEINDNYGHEAGDSLLRAMRDRLAAFVGPRDVLGRTAGDVFAILRVGADRVACERLAKSVTHAVREPHVGAEVTLLPAATIGVACAADVESSIDPLRCADIALYHAKKANRAAVFFEPGMLAALQARKCLEDDLRRALAAGQFDVVYQPIMEPDGRDVVGAEALARWRHPVLGPITPSEFIPLAEECGLIDALGEWVLRRACADAAAWPGELFVAVNVSPVQFRQRDFRQLVERVLAETGLDPQRLELEVTETAVFADELAAEQTIMDLRSCGVRMALDDFGVGYSSLIYLRRFAFDKIKIDRSFLEAMETTGESATIVHSIVHLGRSLGLTVTAEGIETVEQHRFLQAVGCHEMQGFLFSRPATLEDFRKLIGVDAPPLAASA